MITLYPIVWSCPCVRHPFIVCTPFSVFLYLSCIATDQWACCPFCLSVQLPNMFPFSFLATICSHPISLLIHYLSDCAHHTSVPIHHLSHSTQYKYLDTQSVVASVQILNKILLICSPFTLSISALIQVLSHWPFILGHSVQPSVGLPIPWEEWLCYVASQSYR